MKNIRKLASVLLVLVLLCAMAVPAAAANTSITVNNTKIGETYKLYTMFDLKVNDVDAPTAYSYTVNSAWADFFREADAEAGIPAGAGAQYITVNEAGYVTAVSDAAALAKEAAVYAKTLTEKQAITATSDTVVFSGLSNGYHLITSTLGTLAMIETTPDRAEVSVNEKNPENTIEKEVKEDSTGNYGETNSAQVGDLVEFRSTAVLLPGTRNVAVHDEMDSGLSFTSGSISIQSGDTTLVLGTDYTVDESPNDEDTFDILFTDDYINALEESTELVISYTATLNNHAVVKDANGVAIVLQNNKTLITYGDKQSVEDQTTTSTHASIVHKYADGVEYLAGAEFSLKKAGVVVPLIKLDDTNYRVAMSSETGAVNTFVTVSTGDIVIWGLDTDDDYTLEEISAPDGYNKLTAEVELTVSATNDSLTAIVNNTGTVLPETGGRGTTLFYVIGGLMIVGAAVLLVTRRRMSAQ